jgi:hypothetical protein
MNSIRLTQQAYLTDCGLYYTASAIIDGCDAQVYWLIICEDTQGDESNACEWEHPSILKKDGVVIFDSDLDEPREFKFFDCAPIDIEWNEDMIGFVLTFNYGRELNIQFEFNRNSNHPEPDVVPTFDAGCSSYLRQDESLFSSYEYEEIEGWIKSNAVINDVAKAMTVLCYRENDPYKILDFLNLSYKQIIEFAAAEVATNTD